MIKKIVFLSLASIYSNIWSATYIDLHQAPLSRLNQLSSIHQLKMAPSIISNNATLKPLSKTQQGNETITRYQQLYKGIPIVGAQVTVSKNSNIQGLMSSGLVNGHLFDNIQLNTNLALSSKEAIQLAKKSYFHDNTNPQTHGEISKLQIRTDKDNQLQLVYLVSFKSVLTNDKPVWPFFIIDAQTGVITKQWNNFQTYLDSGAGGNEKTHEYWYGKDGLPALEVTQDGPICFLDDEKVSLVNLHSQWDWLGINRKPVQYTCDHNEEDPVHGSFSAGNDAYYFGHTIVSLFKNWYGLNVLQDEKGNAQKLIMRVHFGEWYDNAFWDEDTQIMSFGDGNFLYPLVSLDVAGHEVAHGFTQQHANLEYHDESGALNESFSDMAAQAAKAYLLETTPQLFNKAYLTPNEVTWGIGETLFPATLSLQALRFMDLPSVDGLSADCMDKRMARKQHSICAISYPELLSYAEWLYPDDEDEKQGFIVHQASGIFNRAFYLMANQLGIKDTFRMMLVANIKYWTPTTDFKEGACGVVYAANDLQINAEVVQSSFKKVGIDVTTQCAPINLKKHS